MLPRVKTDFEALFSQGWGRRFFPLSTVSAISTETIHRGSTATTSALYISRPLDRPACWPGPCLQIHGGRRWYLFSAAGPRLRDVAGHDRPRPAVGG